MNKEEDSMNSLERVSTVLSLKEPDYVPIWLELDYFPAKYYDVTIAEMIFDPVKSQKAYEWIYEELGGFDLATPGGSMAAIFYNPFPTVFSAYYLDWKLPGRDLPEDIPPQLAERSVNNPVMTIEDYDKIIENGILHLFSFRNAGIEDLMKLTEIGAMVGQNAEKWKTHYKVPTLADSLAYIPFELLSYLRGSTNFMKDIYRHPDKIKEVSDFMIDGVIAEAEYITTLTGGNTILTGVFRASSDFISDKHFEELVFPYFKKAVTKWINDGFVVQLHCDCDWNSKLHYFKEFPKGKIYLHLDERTDIFKAKEILGDHMCVQGNLKPSLFTLGTPSQLEEKTKEIIDGCADGGGLWVGSEIPGDAKLENVKAVIDTCKTYGKYRK